MLAAALESLLANQFCVICRMHWQAVALMLGCLAASLVSTGSANLSAGLGADVVPTQVIIQFTAKPGALNRPQAMHAVGSSERVASAASASAAASAEHASFRVAASGVVFQTDHVYKHVRIILAVEYNNQLYCNLSSKPLHSRGVP